MTKVVNIRHEKYDTYIGRKDGNEHFGNPFSHLTSPNLSTVKVDSREDSITAFKQWLSGEAWFDVEQERREWIIKNLDSLKDKTLGCFCRPKGGFRGLYCHGQILVGKIDNVNPEDVV